MKYPFNADFLHWALFLYIVVQTIYMYKAYKRFNALLKKHRICSCGFCGWSGHEAETVITDHGPERCPMCFVQIKLPPLR
jgi:hypothetical protein